MMSRLPDDLLKTLEVYLDSGGNATRAARQLFLHRNTLRQRLDRIAALLNVDLTTSERWLPLQLAVKAARLARLTPGATAGGSGSASDISATAKAAK
jgi:DNA-binding PucR family transcriptional regulator